MEAMELTYSKPETLNPKPVRYVSSSNLLVASPYPLSAGPIGSPPPMGLRLTQRRLSFALDALLHRLVRVCVCVCARARARECVCVCERERARV